MFSYRKAGAGEDAARARARAQSAETLNERRLL